jgi:methionyl-tRNA formyltransferase
MLVNNGYPPVAVITAPDKPAGRGLQLQQSPVKQYALAHQIPVMQPTNLKDPGFQAELKAYGADLQIVVAFRMLPEAVWSMPPMGTFNLHASLLPQYRGAAPIHWAVINGETETGLTTFLLQHEIDTGDLLYQVKIPIGAHETTGELHNRMMAAGAELVLKTVKALATRNYQPIPQNTLQAGELKKAPKIFKETCEIRWDLPLQTLYNHIRGLSPYPAAWTTLNGKVCKIYKASPFTGNSPDNNPEVFTDYQQLLLYRAADGYMAIADMQLEGKKRMSVREFLRGYKLVPAL